MPITTEVTKARIEKTKTHYGEDVYRRFGSKGGKSKSLKGLAWVKVNDPKRFKEIMARRSKKVLAIH